jgi:CMP-N-acetylneuraminic acid synthetase
MLKQQLEIELEKASREIREWSDASQDRKETISKLLGAYRKNDNFYGSDRGKILEWDEIFFELGKLYQKANDDRNQIDMTNDIKFLLDCEHRRMKEAENKDKQQEGVE